MKFNDDPWTKSEKEALKRLSTPYAIQKFLDECNYNTTEETRSPRYVLENKRAHCAEGAIFAAACLEFQGRPPLVLDLKAYNDDDHVIAVFKENNCWGSIAKSNFTTLRYREPVYRSLRELAMSYFDLYFNTRGDKSLRSYSLPFNLNRFNRLKWRTTMNDLEDIGYFLDKMKHFPLISDIQAEKLERAAPLLLESSMMGSDPAGLFKPDSKSEK
ncbi:MAG: hypothetical protein K9H49_05215 [Bacteroidales bacterium]|nr:hypothetical protein [Bacteroidales bacterium]MCF8389893.1 hypothetical protein [Bacteroidales bacterium]